MEHFTFLKYQASIKSVPLGGLEAQLKLAPETRKISTMKKTRSNAKKAAVLVLFYPGENNKTHLLLTLRAQYNGTHSAQVSFPGGKVDLKDKTLQQTALRECFEEVGVSSKKITLVKEMTDIYIPPSNFLVTPFIGFASQKLNFTRNKEVAQIIEVPLKDLLNDGAIHFENKIISGASNVQIPYFLLNDHKVWGATAMIISEVKELLKSLSF
jgi:8-oxo-dGTP pyrophosphatase MutT (NUDIX family)